MNKDSVIGWPEKLVTILLWYFKVQQNDPNHILSDKQKDNLAKRLIKAYDSLSLEDKKDILVPAKGEYIQDHAITCEKTGSGINYRININYKWPRYDGFRTDIHEVSLTPGGEYDRLGNTNGRFLSPLFSDGSSASFLERALPYYVPEDDIRNNPAYHKYRVRDDYEDYGDVTFLEGEIAHAFWDNPDDGTSIKDHGRVAKQIKTPFPVSAITDEVFEEGNIDE